MKLYKLCSFLLVLAMLASCKKNFIELNKNPNTLDYAFPKTLLAPAFTDVAKFNLNQSGDLNNSLMQVDIDMGGTDAKPFRYDLPSSLSIAPYNNWYLQLVNFKDIYTSAANRFNIDEARYNKTYMGISLICEAWVMSLITDTYGDVPFTDAGKVKEQVFLPKFDAQKDIYAGIFAKLEEANTLLEINADLPADESGSDPLYKGVASNWRKFGNSLYLRLLLRVSAKSELNTPAKITEMVANPTDYPLIGSNNESAILRWTGTAPYDSPYATSKDVTWNTRAVTEFFVNNLKDWNDPRIAKWVTQVNGEYAGIPGGYPTDDVPKKKSTKPTSLRTEPLLGNILNYSEVQFMLAEAASRGWIPGSAQTYYETGITAHINLWGLTVPADYLSAKTVAWSDAASLDQKLEKIHLQKYYSLYFTDFQQWFEYRRTGHPELPVGLGLLNDGKMPARLLYPVYLQTTNGANLKEAVSRQGPDDINTMVWWQKP